MTSIMEKNYFYILSVNYIISTQYQLLASSSPAPPTSPLSTLSFSSNYYRRSTTYWVFWYYGDSGDRQCGNYCIIVFSIVAFLLLCIILCGCLKCYFIRQRYKEDEKYTGDSSIENTLAAVWPDQARKEQEEAAELQKKRLNEQYPPLKSSSSSTTASPSSPLSSNHDNNPPPAYGDETVGDEPNFFHNLRRRSPFQAVRHANKFSKDHPPFEALPPTDHMNFLKVTGINAWKFSNDNLIRANIISILNDRGNKIKFNLKLDAMVQTNYPLVKLYEFNENTNENSNNNEDYDNNSSNSSSNSNNNVVHKIVPKPSQAHLLSNDGQHQDLSLAPPPYESPSTSALGKPGKWFYYYEVTILSNPNKKDTTIAIGLATKPYPNYRLPGWSIHSVGYHSNNGNKFHNESFAGREYGEKWGDEGDTIGCGYYPNTGYVFFTKNGKFQGIAFTGLFHIWFPTIGTDGECNMEINFGNNNNGKEFVYQEATGMSVCGPINNKIISNENELYISKDEKNDYNL